MLSLDLFDSRYEKKLHEGAVDDTIAQLIEPLSRRAMDIRTQIRSGRLDSKQVAKLEKEYEDLVQKRLDIILDRKAQTQEAEQPQRPPAKGLLKGKDLVTPQQRVAGATPPATSMMGKAKETLGSFANWLAGKDDTGPTYESQLKETDPNSAINAAKYAYEQIRRAHDDNVDTATIRWMNGGEPVTMSRNQLYHTVQKLKAMSRQNRNAFALQTLANRNNFNLWLGSQKKIMPRPQLKQPSDPFQPELPLGKPKIGPVQERIQKKKSDDIQAGDVKVAREIQKLRARYPAARSDVEAVARAEIDSTERSQRQLAAISGANEKQDALLKQLVALDQEQGREIDNLDQENTSLERQLDQIQSTNDRLQRTIGQMTGTKKSSRSKTVTKPQPAPAAVSEPVTVSVPVTPAEPAKVEPVKVDPVTLAKVQDLETKINKLQDQPQTPEIEKKIDALQSRINALPAQAAKALNIDTDLDQDKKSAGKKSSLKKSAGKVPRPQAPAGDLDLEPPKKSVRAPKKSVGKSKVSAPVPDDEIDILDLEEPTTVEEHGGGIGPKKHWQSLMRETGRPPMDTINYYFPDINAQSDVEAIRAAIKQIVNNPELSKTSKQRLLGQVGMMVQRNRALIGREWRQYLDRFTESDEHLVEGIKDTASATAVIACLLTGGSLTGCATAPQQTSAQQVLKTGQDIGRTVQSAKKITRAGTEAEVQQELRTILRGINRPEELNNSNILRIWKKIKGQPPVPPEPDVPEYGPAEPRKRMPQTEAKEPTNQEEYFAIIDRLDTEIRMEQDRAVRQMLMLQRGMLEKRAQASGWIPKKELREDTAALAAEDAILKRIFVKHRDLMMEYGPDKITQAAESVAYNVGDIAHITDEQINEWVGQVEYILGARP